MRGVAFVVALVVAAGATAQMTETPKIRFRQIVKIRSNGDADIHNDLTFSTQMYTNIKKQITNTKLLLRELGIAGEATELVDPKVQYDDGNHAITVDAGSRGEIKNRGREWFVEYMGAENIEVVDTDPDAITLLAVNQLDTGVLVVGTSRVEFPSGSRNIRFDARRGGLFWEMPAPPSKPDGTVDPDVVIDVRPELMSCLYKVYGNPKFTKLWVARMIFRNRGNGSATDLRVRFRIPEYSSWSPWKRNRVVYPTQTVVEAFYPILMHKIRDLKSGTPASLECEWEYKTPDGRSVQDSDTRRLTILGMNEVMFSSLPAPECTTWFEMFDYSPLISATFVSHTDPIMQRFAGMAAKVSGGAGASINDENAYKFMKAVYDVICTNQIKYQSPPGLWKKGVRQHVKFGRDVLRNRAGTCIDLAILYASACQAGGLDPCLVLIPGHCFPAIKTPGGGIQAVEATCVSGDDKGQMIPFQKAAMIGQKELSEAAQKGLFYLVDIQKLRAQGVPTPELPDLPTSALNDWGIRADAGGARPVRPVGPRPVGPGPQPPVPQPPGPDPVPQPPGPDPVPQPPQPQPGNMKVVRDPNGAYQLSVPANWQVQQQGQGLAAVDPTGGASLMCMASQRQAQSLQAFVQQMCQGFQQSVPNWKMLGQKNIQVGNVQAVHVRASGQPKGMSLLADYIFCLTQQKQIVLMLTCQQDKSQQFQGSFNQVVQSFQVR